MPDSRTHRSAGPGDSVAFAAEQLPRLVTAAEHLSWLRTRGYAERSTLKLVGDRFDLSARQRLAVGRAACSDAERTRRLDRRVAVGGLRGATLSIDGFNVLTTVEVALGGGVVLLARDGCMRDVASLHGTWRRVEETVPAIELVGSFLAEAGVARADWLLDAPVSNSGRLRALLEECAQRRGWSWTARVDRDPDATLLEIDTIVASADRRVLDGCTRWFNLAAEVIATRVPDAWFVDLGYEHAR